jgi:hypothetical protein
MADTKIKDLTDGVTANATDRIPVTRDPTGSPLNRYITPSYLKTYVLGSGVTPNTNDGAALGSGTTSWSDLFLASGGVINFNNGDVTLAHSTNLLTFDGGNYSFYNTSDTNNWQIINAYNTSTGTSAVAGLTVNAGTATGSLFMRGSGHASLPSTLHLTNVANAALYLGVNNVDEVVLTTTAFSPAASDGNALGTTSLMWSDLFLASGGIINFNSGDITLTHSNDVLTLGGSVNAGKFEFDLNDSGGYPALGIIGSSAGFGGYIRLEPVGTGAAEAFNGGLYTYPRDNLGAVINGAYVGFYTTDATAGSFDDRILIKCTTNGNPNGIVVRDANLLPWNNDATALGSTAVQWSDLFLASGGVINWNNGDVTLTHSSNLLTFAGGDYAFNGVTTVASATATPAGGSTSARLLFGTTSGFGIYYGSGVPSVSAAQGSLYLRSDGSSTSTRMYVNNSSGSGTTWTAVTTAA